jgi:O-antigen/teichoic acid export membrane protein
MYLKNTSWLLFDKLVRIFGGLFIGIWIARYLGPSDFGVLNYALAYVAFFQVFVNLGLNQIVVREVVKYPKLTNYILGTAFGLKFFGSILALIGVFISLLFIQTDYITKLVIFILTIRIVFQSVDVIDYFFQAKVISKYTVIARNLAYVFTSALTIFFIVNEYSVMYFALTLTIEVLLSSLFLFIIYEKIGKSVRQFRFSKKIAINLIKFAWPLALSVFLISIHMRIDQVMIGSMLNIEQVGIYSVAVKLSAAWLFIPAILVSTLMPYFVNLRKTNSSQYLNKLLMLYSLMFWMGVSVGLLTIVYGESMIQLLFGVEYVGAYMALVFNIWNGIFISQAVARGIWMISEDLQIFRLYNNIIAVILNIIANLVLIPKYGIAGAAMATLATQAICTWGVSFLWKPLRSSTWAMIRSIYPVFK